jgi:hypothetical protein
MSGLSNRGEEESSFLEIEVSFPDMQLTIFKKYKKGKFWLPVKEITRSWIPLRGINEQRTKN